MGHSLIASNPGSDHRLGIECVSLADIFADNAITHCDLLKLDCEGAELEILEAAPPGILRESAGSGSSGIRDMTWLI